MDIQTRYPEQYIDQIIAERLQAAQPFRFGGPSPVVSIVGRLAKAIRRGASGIEGWAYGAPETPASSQRTLSVR